jgi:hypothetical protein
VNCLRPFATPEQCKASRVTIEEAADDEGRAIDPEHFGVMVLYTHDDVPDAFAQAIRTRNPDAEIDDLVAHGVLVLKLYFVYRPTWNTTLLHLVSSNTTNDYR